MEMGDRSPREVTFGPGAFNAHMPDPLRPILEREAMEWLERIRSGTTAFLAGDETTDDFQVHCQAIKRYMRLKYPLSNTDLVLLARALHRAVLMEESIHVQCKRLGLLARVLGKCAHRERDGNHLALELPWRPLLQLLLRVHFPSHKGNGHIGSHVREYHGRVLVRALRKARRFFPLSAIQEILEFVMPMMGPHDSRVFQGQALLHLFLCLPYAHRLTESDAETATHLVSSILDFWEWMSNSLTWDGKWGALLGHIAKCCCGKMNWDAFLPRIATQFLRALDLSAGHTSKPEQVHLPAALHVFPSASCLRGLGKVFVYALGSPTSTSQEALDGVMARASHALHPLSSNRSVKMRLSVFLSSLGRNFAKRMGNTQCQLPLPEARRFVQALTPSLLMGLFGKDEALARSIQEVMKHVAYVCPEDILPAFLEKALPALESLTETHRTVATLDALTVLAHPLLHRAIYPAGSHHLPVLLSASLPGVDVNDATKTLSTLHFYFAVLTTIHLWDATETDVSVAPDVMNVDSITRTATQTLGEWALEFLNRLLVVFQHMEEPPKHANWSEAFARSTYRRVLDAFFMQLPTSLFDVALRRIITFLTDGMHPNALRYVGHTVAAASFASPSRTLSLVLPVLYKKILSTSSTVDLSDDSLSWYLRMVSQVVRRTGRALLHHLHEIHDILTAVFAETGRKVSSAKGAYKLLRNTLRSLVDVYLTETRNVPRSQWEDAKFQAVHYLRWGEWSTLQNLGEEWHTPSQEELSEAVSLADEFAQKAAHMISSREAVPHALCILRAVLRGISSSSAPIPPTCAPEAVYGPACSGVLEDRPFKHVLPLIASTLQQMLSSEMEGRAPEVALVCKVCYELFYHQYGADIKKDRLALRVNSWLKNHFRDFSRLRRGPGARMKENLPRVFHLERLAALFRLRRADHARYAAMGKHERAMCQQLLSLCTHPFSAVRKKAQDSVLLGLKKDPLLLQEVIETSLTVLTREDAAPEAITGSIYLLISKRGLREVTSHRNWATRLVSALCSNTRRPDKVSIQQRLDALAVQYAVCYHPLAWQPEEVPLLDFSKATTDHWRLVLLRVAFVLLHLQAKMKWAVSPQMVRWLVECLKEDVSAIRHAALLALTILLRWMPALPCPEQKDAGRKKTVEEVEKNWMWLGFTTPTAVEEGAMRQDTLDVLRMELCREEVTSCIVSSFCRDHHLPPEGAGSSGPRRWLTGRHGAKLQDLRALLPASVQSLVSAALATVNRKEPSRAAGEVILEGVSSSLKALHHTTRSGTCMSDAFTYTHAAFVEACARGLGPGVLCGFLKATRAWMEHVTEREATCAVAEVMSGLVRGSKRWSSPSTDLSSLRESFRVCLNRVDELSVEAVGDWAEALRYLCAGRSIVQIEWLWRDLFARVRDALEGSDSSAGTVTSTGLARRLRLLQPVLLEMSWRGKPFAAELLPLLPPVLVHPFKQVREEVGRLLWLVGRCEWKPQRPSSVIAQSLLGTTDVAVMPDFVMTHIVTLLERFATEEREEEMVDLREEKHLNRERGRETVIYWLSRASQAGHWVIQDHGAGLTARLLPLLLFLLDNRRPELTALAQSGLSFLAGSPWSGAPLRAVVAAVSTSLDTPFWHVRMAMASFILAIHARLPAHCGDEEVETARRGFLDVLFALLQDRSQEVREATCRALADVMRGVRPSEAIEWITRCKALDEGETERHRHACALGLSALVLAFPFSVPTWMPDLLVCLVQLGRDPSRPRETIRRTLVEFKHTHGKGTPEWEEHRQHFTSSQLDALSDGTGAGLSVGYV